MTDATGGWCAPPDVQCACGATTWPHDCPLPRIRLPLDATLTLKEAALREAAVRALAQSLDIPEALLAPPSTKSHQPPDAGVECDPAHNPTVAAVVATLRQLASWGVARPVLDGEWYALADAVLACCIGDPDGLDALCCPMCEEVTCDGDCPLAPVRPNP